MKPHTPLSIPEAKSGNYAIVHDTSPPNTIFFTANMRCQMFGGQKTKKVSWDHETVWHRLQGPSGTWMTDVPCEQAQMTDCIKKFKGKILVGGLGLGLVATLLAQKKPVSHITIIEKSPEVISLVASHIKHPKITVVNDDLFDYLKTTNKVFTHSFYDIWQSDGEGTFFNVVCPLYSLSKTKVKHPPVNWQESVMRGQLKMSLVSTMMLQNHPDIDTHYPNRTPLHELSTNEHEMTFHDWSVPLFKWVKEKNPNPQQLEEGMQLYAGMYGSWGFERYWEMYSKLTG